MFDTKESDFNIVDATPFKRDILKELAEECQKQGIKLHFYYSHLDWFRDDYPEGSMRYAAASSSPSLPNSLCSAILFLFVQKYSFLCFVFTEVKLILQRIWQTT